METLTANLNGAIRHETLNGRAYLVAPARMLIPGVLSGSNGPLHYSAETVASNHDNWNHMPLTLYHPTIDGNPVSARRPDVLNKQGLGFVFETKFGDALDSELWFDVEQLRKKAAGVLQSLERNEKIELSTGLFVESEVAPVGAVYNGVAYTHAVKSIRPDHLAILPDQVGACSLRAGCGVLVNQACDACGSKPDVAPDTPVDNESYFKDCPRDAKGHCKADGTGESGSKVDAKPAAGKGEGKPDGSKAKNKSQECKCADGTTVELPIEESGSVGGNIIAVKNQSSDTSGQVPDNPSAEVNKVKEQLIQWLTANCSCWKGTQDKETLNALPEEKLVQLKASAEQGLASNVLVANLRKEIGAIDGADLATALRDKLNTVLVAPGVTQNRLTAEEADDLAWARQERVRQKALLVDRLLVNVSDTTMRQAKGQFLMKKPESELKDLLDLIPTPQARVRDRGGEIDFSRPLPPNYGGMAGGYVGNHQEDDTDNLLPIHDYDYDTKVKQA